MKLSIRLMLCVVILMSISCEGMLKTSNQVKKLPKSTFGVGSKNSSMKRYRKSGVATQSSIDQPVEMASRDSAPMGMTMEEMPRSAWYAEGDADEDQELNPDMSDRDVQFPERGATFFDTKKKRAQWDLQKRGYSTNVTPKTAFMKRMTGNLEQGKTSFLKDESVATRVGNLFFYPRSSRRFADEPKEYSKAQQKLLSEGKKKGITIPMRASHAVQLAHGDEIAYVKDLLKEEYKSFLPMIDSALRAENSALKKGKPVLYHGMSKEHYKYVYILTKIMELQDDSYPGFLMLRAPTAEYTPEEDPTVIRETLLEKGSKSDMAVQDQYHLMSAGNSLFTHILYKKDTSYKAGPLQYAVEGTNISSMSPDFKTFCKKYHLEDYCPEIDALFKNTDIKGDGGVLLQCIFDKKLLKKTVYASINFGRKRSDSDFIIENLTQLEKIDISKLTELQFRIILTDDLLLDPKNPETRRGFRVNVYAQDQDALDEFHATVDAFFEALKKEREKIRKGGR